MYEIVFYKDRNNKCEIEKAKRNLRDFMKRSMNDGE